MSGDEFDKISAKLVGRSVQPWPPNQSTHTGYEKRFLSSWPSLGVLCWIWDWDFCTAATQTTSLRDNKDQYIYKKMRSQLSLIFLIPFSLFRFIPPR